MDFFKFRKKGDPAPSTSVQPESVERMRQRAKHRLIGAAVLVLIGVIGFPLLFDKQPRPIAVDTPIDIPDKNKVPPLVLPEAPASKASAVAPITPPPVTPVPAVEPKPATPPSVVITETAEPPKPVKPEASAVNPPVAAKPAEVNKAQALLDGKAADAQPAASDGRFVVQVGAFADAARAREVRLKVERAGLKTYTNVAETKDGKRIRVRVGPFTTRADAEKAAEKIKKLNLPAVLLTL
ncbi:SPOR domain-containing protein [Rhodoferax sp.]|uniref:SPOR domain-containing protein n=1 Tax=Rhodoferax sp. TaxID=50421 RepID=UPI0026137D92|nr:SPOR domain-containing protein [Rhodoferax sp.]MDD2917706.1 SPOR domain-containing protein [Rhodoferax sp.]